MIKYAGMKAEESGNNRKYLLEGRVQSSFQKQFALFTLLKKTKTTAVENRLRMI